jgi:hypothetical protein
LDKNKNQLLDKNKENQHVINASPRLVICCVERKKKTAMERGKVGLRRSCTETEKVPFSRKLEIRGSESKKVQGRENMFIQQ